MEMCTFYFIIPCSLILAPSKKTIQKIKLELSGLLFHGGKVRARNGKLDELLDKIFIGSFYVFISK